MSYKIINKKPEDHFTSDLNITFGMSEGPIYMPPVITVGLLYKISVRTIPMVTGNCQMLTFQDAFSIESKSHLELILGVTYAIIGSYRVLHLDIQEHELEKIRKHFKDIAYKFSIKRYISSNGSRMVTCIVHIARRTAQKLFRHYSKLLNEDGYLKDRYKKYIFKGEE